MSLKNKRKSAHPKAARKKRGAGLPDWARPIDDQFWLHNVLRLYPALNIWGLRVEGGEILRWWQMTPVTVKLEPYHFEPPFENPRARYEYQRDCALKVLKSRKPLVSRYKGFYDLTLPLPGPAGKHAVLFAGQFSRGHLSESDLRQLWQKLTGQAASSANPAFVAYVRSALAMPVFDDEVLEGIKLLLRRYACVLTGRPGEKNFQKKAQALMKRLLARHLPHPGWASQALSPEKQRVVPWSARKELEDYEKEELGISRVPTTVLALLPLEPPFGSRDPVYLIVRNAALQRRCFLLAKGLPETLAENLGDYGVVFLTSADPLKSQADARRELKERAELIRDTLRKEDGIETVLAIGGIQQPGETLAPSYQQAVSSLHHGLHGGKPVMFYDEIPIQQKKMPLSDLQESAATLAQELESLSSAGVRLSVDACVQRVLTLAAPRTDLAQALFFGILLWLMEVQRSRGRMAPHECESFLAEFHMGAAELGTVYEVAALFRERVDRLLHTVFPAEPSRQGSRLEATLKFLKHNFHQSLSLKKVAKDAGLSVTVFCTLFKKVTGKSFVAYVQDLRVSHAQQLLRSTPLGVEEISQLSGFNSPRHFARTFKGRAKLSPRAYRSGVLGAPLP